MLFLVSILKIYIYIYIYKVGGKTTFFVTGPFVVTIVPVLTLTFDRLVLYGNVALSVAVVVRSTKNGTPFFPKKFSFFGKII